MILKLSVGNPLISNIVLVSQYLAYCSGDLEFHFLDLLFYEEAEKILILLIQEKNMDFYIMAIKRTIITGNQ